MILLAGLGNPGKKYKDTRHNIGFLVIDKFKEINNFPEFKLSKKFNSLVSEGFIDSKKVILAKPQTFMNESGKAVKALVSFYKIKVLFVAHDDIDLPLGKIKIAKGQGAAGHKGVKSIIKEIGTKDFTRIRIGISPEKKPKNVEKFVLQKFNKENKTSITTNINNTASIVTTTIIEEIKKR